MGTAPLLGCECVALTFSFPRILPAVQRYKVLRKEVIQQLKGRNNALDQTPGFTIINTSGMQFASSKNASQEASVPSFH